MNNIIYLNTSELIYIFIILTNFVKARQFVIIRIKRFKQPTHNFKNSTRIERSKTSGQKSIFLLPTKGFSIFMFRRDGNSLFLIKKLDRLEIQLNKEKTEGLKVR